MPKRHKPLMELNELQDSLNKNMHLSDQKGYSDKEGSHQSKTSTPRDNKPKDQTNDHFNESPPERIDFKNDDDDSSQIFKQSAPPIRFISIPGDNQANSKVNIYNIYSV